MSDFVKWFIEHKDEIRDVEQRQKFMTRALHELVHVFTYVVEDIQNLEGRFPGQNNLILPNIHKLDQSLRQGGDTR